ncbi:MAG: mechanosensitive ion channel family protein [Phycisphaerae bacterium]|jgi:MscS family membrane protein|nr:mechanosensitive ion channel family protein [Phycisphaerae bacterium]
MSGCVILAAQSDAFWQIKFLGNEPWRWLVLVGVLFIGLVAGKVVSFFLVRQARRLEAAGRLELTAKLLQCIAKPITLVALACAMYAAATFMNFDYLVAVEKNGVKVTETRSLDGFWLNVCKAVAVLAVGWFIYRLVDVVEHFLLRWTSRTETQLDDQLVPLIRKTLRVVVVIVASLFIAQNIFHWNIGALVAGLGLGGLAFALAARDMLANLFGSVTIFADRPFQLGDRIRVAGNDGMVEEVGFRSTRIRTLTGHQVTLPNAVVANSPVENIGRRPFIKRSLDVTVTYDTSPEKVHRAVEILREMCDARKGHFDPDFPPRVFFSEFNADSLGISVFYWFTPPDWWGFLAFNHEFNMELLRRFNEEGIEFAFPTQTLYVRQDSPLEADVRIKPSNQPR